MNYIKRISISLLYIISSIAILSFIFSLSYYFNILSEKAISIFKILTLVISLFIGGVNIGKSSNKKGWLEGLKLALIFIILLIIFNFIFFKNPIHLKNFIYYLIIIISTIFGSMIGISIKKID